MTQKILAIGNALVDIIARIDEDLLVELDLTPGGMTLVEAQKSARIYDALHNPRAVSGGSAANTAAIAAGLGASVSFAGKTTADELGHIFNHDLRTQGIDAVVPAGPEETGQHTGSCLSLITPDAQRTMCTHLGAAQALHPQDISLSTLEAADIVFVEGYLLDAPHGYAILDKVIAARPPLLALTLSDAGCVERHAAYLGSVLDHVGLLFGNAEEMRALLPEAGSAHMAALAAAGRVHRIVCTDGPQGIYLGENGKVVHLPARKAVVTDTTGAGDSIAGSILFGIATQMSFLQAGEIALRVAAEVISEIGARPSRDIRQMLRDEDLLESELVPQ